MKNALRWAFLAVAAGFVGWALVSGWDEVAAAMRTMSWAAFAGSLAAAVMALGLSLQSWRAVMRSVGLTVGVAPAARVFLVSQIGKYVPGSIWPVLAQAEFARDHGVSRARAMTGAIVAMIVGAATAGLVGGVGVLIAVPHALTTYWWALPVVLGMGIVLIPAVLFRLVALAFRVTRREEAPVRIGAKALVISVMWAALQWVMLGVHAWLLVRAIAPEAGLALAIGAFAFAWLVGFIVVIAPAGAGAREAALVFALASVATPAQALTVALVSRFVMTVADVAGFGVGMVVRGGRQSAGD